MRLMPIIAFVFITCSCNNSTPGITNEVPSSVDSGNVTLTDSTRNDKNFNDVSEFISHAVDLKKQFIKLYWKDGNHQPLRSLQRLKEWLDSNGRKLIFAMNGGMYKTDNSPLGLFIENGKTVTPLNTRSASGNFYLKPNGVFYITHDNLAMICTTDQFKTDPKIKYATQSGPMLVVNGEIHDAFSKGSKNVNIRNGVGILPNGNVLFAMSKTLVNFYDFAEFFKKAGCKNALYFDGFVSRTYLPEKNWIQTGGDFGVIIAESVVK